MKIIAYVFTLLSILTLSLLVSCGPNSSQPSPIIELSPISYLNIKSKSHLVLVDQSDPAFTVFQGIPKNFDKSKLDKIKSNISKQEKISIITWHQFIVSVNDFALSTIVRNDYPTYRIVDGLVCLLASEEVFKEQWGLTWNGGIAFTFNDFKHARKTYGSYKVNPASYKPIRDPRGDPNNPGGFLGYFRCD